MVYVTRPRPQSGMVFHHEFALATINLCTKLETSNSTHYGDMKGDTKCVK